MNSSTVSAATQSKLETCDELQKALAGNIGETVAAHERMILKYYADVQKQAEESFNSAKRAALIGFGVLIATLLYTLTFDALSHFEISKMKVSSEDWLKVSSIGVVSGVLIEFIAAINFWLYRNAARQFNAFHICLERTHRYLIAYKMIEEIGGEKKADIAGKVVCIMANAPMITAQDIGAVTNQPSKKT
jgi:Cyanobacterial TRADD-N associated 2-Transmembrane domain